MTKRTIDLQNCYGIKSLTTEFDFSEKRTFAIYAPNGAMKSSFAQTFRDVAAGVESRDPRLALAQCKMRRLMYPDQTSPLVAAQARPPIWTCASEVPGKP